jgi:transposase
MQSPLFVGVDVAKDNVVVACSQASFPARSVSNTTIALKAFLRTLPTQCHIAMEATGCYYQNLADLAHKLGLQVYVLNPRDLCHYAKGVGMRAKTDRVDAALIARFLAHEADRLRPYEPATAEQRKMDQLLRRRAKAVTLKTALRLACAQDAFIRTETAKVIKAFDALLKKIDSQIALLNRATPERACEVQRLQTIPGVGVLTASWLANLMDRVKFSNSDALVAFAGMDPRPCDSGQKRGRRRLSKRGPAEGRRLLFNAAMAAIRCPAWKDAYAHYRERGWTTTAAILIIARKILRIAFAMHNAQAVFDPRPFGERTASTS